MKLFECMQSWKFRPDVQAMVDTALDKVDSYQKPTIAFHVRGGDKVTEDEAVVSLLSARVFPTKESLISL